MFYILSFILGCAVGSLIALRLTRPGTQFVEPRYDVTSGTSTVEVHGGAQFIESVTPRQKFEQAKDVGDLIQ